MGQDTGKRFEIAEGMLGGHRLQEVWGGYAPCPGQSSHGGKNGPKDFRVILDGAPTGYCVHNSCEQAVTEWNKALRRAIWEAEHGGVRGDGTAGTRKDDDRSVAAQPMEPKLERRQDLDLAAVMRVVHGMPEISRDWLRRRSPMDVTACGFEEFFTALFDENEKVMIFTSFTSQGDFMWWVGRGGFRLGDDKGGRIEPAQVAKSVPSNLPTVAKCGIWFLSNPVDGCWYPVKHLAREGRKFSRRSEPSVTSFRYLVLESDSLGEELWLKVLVKLKLPIAAVYTSGSKSVHALVRLSCGSKAEWDHLRNELSPLLTKLGADYKAMSAVRLTRLPFTLRRGSQRKDGTYVEWERPGKQELLWLDAMPGGGSMISKPECRE